jgi:hypothetical protein
MVRMDKGEWLDVDGTPMCCKCRQNRSRNPVTLYQSGQRITGADCPFCTRIRSILSADEEEHGRGGSAPPP